VILGLARTAYGEWDGPFEQKVGKAAAALKAGAERWYKPLLVKLLDLEAVARGQAPGVNVLQLGDAMAQLRTAGLGVFVDGDVRIVRNAEAHALIDIDVPSETVRFSNTRRDGQTETVGPWNETQLREFVERFLRLGVAISLAFVAFVVDEICAALDREGWRLSAQPHG
jgi:hypothetical protein